MSQVIAFNKPYGVLSCFTDPEGRPTLKIYIPILDIYAVGRLDFDSEGLLLLSDDGKLIQRLSDPRFHQPKTYWVQVEGQITEQALDKLRRGVVIQGWRTRPCQADVIPEPDLPPRVKPITPHKPPSWIQITLTEGKKRQVRHMTAEVGFPTLRLVRWSIGNISLAGLQPGNWRVLTAEEIKNQIGY